MGLGQGGKGMADEGRRECEGEGERKDPKREGVWWKKGEREGEYDSMGLTPSPILAVSNVTAHPSTASVLSYIIGCGAIIASEF